MFLFSFPPPTPYLILAMVGIRSVLQINVLMVLINIPFLFLLGEEWFYENSLFSLFMCSEASSFKPQLIFQRQSSHDDMPPGRYKEKYELNHNPQSKDYGSLRDDLENQTKESYKSTDDIVNVSLALSPQLVADIYFNYFLWLLSIYFFWWRLCFYLTKRFNFIVSWAFHKVIWVASIHNVDYLFHQTGCIKCMPGLKSPSFYYLSAYNL